MAADPRFDFYEQVIISTDDPALSEISGELGAVLGRSCGEGGGWSYAVRIYRTGRCWSCMEVDLRTNGTFDRPEAFFPGSSIRVSLGGEVLGWNR